MTSFCFLEEKIGYRFKNQQLIQSALTHSSVRHKGKLFERLEFLGDRVLGLVVADLLYKRFPSEKEGDLAKRSAALVRREACDKVARFLSLQDYLVLVSTENIPNNAILANAMEALIGAMYLDGGLSPCHQFIQQYWEELLSEDIKPPKDAKSSLQEWAQSKGKPIPVYNVIECTGPGHAPFFRVGVFIESLSEVIGEGASKRQAEQNAAKILLESLKK
jgi:ribonuclease-3